LTPQGQARARGNVCAFGRASLIVWWLIHCLSRLGQTHTKDCYPEGCAAPGDVQCQCNAQGPLSKLERAPSQRKINVTSKSPVGDISVVTLIRTDTTLDHSQKAEKVCSTHSPSRPMRASQIRGNSWRVCAWARTWCSASQCLRACAHVLFKGVGGFEAPAKIQEVTLMRPFHGNL